ncbi:hypothetical protein CJ030_MR2G012904 [Morella rubra]|uniref:Uncharacterized protein n=1 Tax=Morella rubra TaxID=262757 RepID=A0A6A1WIU3_9ROSI|nr:hypothetical protein CJ030_MR2G012904 [Morella rubra]
MASRDYYCTQREKRGGTVFVDFYPYLLSDSCAGSGLEGEPDEGPPLGCEGPMGSPLIMVTQNSSQAESSKGSPSLAKGPDSIRPKKAHAFNEEQYGPTDSELSSPFGELIFHKGDFFKAGAAPCLRKNSAKKKGKDLLAVVERQTRSNQMRFQLRCYINKPGW